MIVIEQTAAKVVRVFAIGDAEKLPSYVRFLGGDESDRRDNRARPYYVLPSDVFEMARDSGGFGYADSKLTDELLRHGDSLDHAVWKADTTKTLALI